MSKEIKSTATLNSDRNSNTTAETPETENEKEESKKPNRTLKGTRNQIYLNLKPLKQQTVCGGLVLCGVGVWVEAWWSNTRATNLVLGTLCPYFLMK